MDDFQVAKLEFEAVVNNALEDSPSRQLARQKLQKVRSLRGTATASPLYHAVLEDMIGGGLGSGKKSARHGAPRGHVLLHGRRVPKAELQGATLHKLARLWLLDSPTAQEQDSSIDVFNMPPLPPREYAEPAAEPAGRPTKRAAVEQVLHGGGVRETAEQLRAQVVQRGRRSRAAHIAQLKAQEKQSARLLHLEARLNVSLRDK